MIVNNQFIDRLNNDKDFFKRWLEEEHFKKKEGIYYQSNFNELESILNLKNIQLSENK